MVMPPQQFVDVDGVKTRYFKEGKGEPVLLLHGGNCGDADNVDCADNWGLNWEFLSKHFQVFAIDRLGQGYTDNPKPGEYTIENVVGHVRKFMEKMQMRGVHLVGHSRGGYMALRVTREDPNLVRSLTIIDSSTTASGDNVLRGPLLADAPTPLRSRESIAWVTRRFSFSDAVLTDDWLDARAAIGSTEKNNVAVKTFPRTLEPSLLKQKLETLEWVKSGGLRTPTMLFWGKNDPSAILPRGLELFDLIARSAPISSLHIFNQAGHYCYREHPRAFAEILSAFIRAL